MTVTLCSWCKQRGRAPAMRSPYEAVYVCPGGTYEPGEWMHPKDAAESLSTLAAGGTIPERSHSICDDCKHWQTHRPSLVRRAWWMVRRMCR